MNVFLNPVFCTIGKMRFSHIPHTTGSSNVEHFYVWRPFFCTIAKMIIFIINVTTECSESKESEQEIIAKKADWFEVIK